MRHVCLMGLAALALTLTALAQDQPASRPGRGMRQGPPGARGPGLDMVARRLAEELKLSDEQRAKYDALVAKYEAQARAPAQERETEQLRALGEQLREARRSGDQARIDELREQMVSLRAGRPQITNAFLDEVGGILTPQQQDTLKQFRDRLRSREDATQRAGDLRELVRTLPEALGLNDEQKARLDQLLAEQRQQMRERFEQARDTRPRLEEELRQAREAGDQARVAELEAKLEAQRPEVAGFQELFEKLEPILTPEQKVELDKLRTDLASASQPATGPLQGILRAARRLDLNDEQRDRLRAIVRDARDAERKGTRDDQARADLVKTVKSQITEMLDAKQAAEFERLLAGERPGRSARPGAGEGRGPASRPA